MIKRMKTLITGDDDADNKEDGEDNIWLPWHSTGDF